MRSARIMSTTELFKTFRPTEYRLGSAGELLPLRDESDNYMAHLATLLVRDEQILMEAIADTERLLGIQAELNTRIAAAFIAAGLGRANQ